MMISLAVFTMEVAFLSLSWMTIERPWWLT
jgi:hypothetical protein